jgi:hypothetical protein
MKGRTSLVLGALLVAGLSLALACSGAPTSDVDETVQAAVVATLTAHLTGRPLPSPTPTPTATPIDTPTATPTATPTPEPRPGYAWPSEPEGSTEPVNHHSGVLHHAKGALPDPPGLAETPLRHP